MSDMECTYENIITKTLFQIRNNVVYKGAVIKEEYRFIKTKINPSHILDLVNAGYYVPLLLVGEGIPVNSKEKGPVIITKDSALLDTTNGSYSER
jgi:hypothetical protein